MQPRELQVIADGFTYLEGPRWHDGALWFVDFYTPQDAFDAGGVGHGGEGGVIRREHGNLLAGGAQLRQARQADGAALRQRRGRRQGAVGRGGAGVGHVGTLGKSDWQQKNARKSMRSAASPLPGPAARCVAAMLRAP